MRICLSYELHVRQFSTHRCIVFRYNLIDFYFLGNAISKWDDETTKSIENALKYIENMRWELLKKRKEVIDHQLLTDGTNLVGTFLNASAVACPAMLVPGISLKLIGYSQENDNRADVFRSLKIIIKDYEKNMHKVTLLLNKILSLSVNLSKFTNTEVDICYGELWAAFMKITGHDYNPKVENMKITANINVVNGVAFTTYALCVSTLNHLPSVGIIELLSNPSLITSGKIIGKAARLFSILYAIKSIHDVVNNIGKDHDLIKIIDSILEQLNKVSEFLDSQDI